MGVLDDINFNNDPTAITVEKPVVEVEETQVEGVKTESIAEEVVEPTATETDTEEVQKEVPKPIELNDDLVLEYIRKNTQKEVNSFDDLFKKEEIVKEVVKEVNPYEDVKDDYIKKYLEFSKETGLGRREFEFVQKDFSSKSPLELAKDKIRYENKGIDVSDSEIKSFLEKTLEVDLSQDEISNLDKIQLNNFVKEYRSELVSLQEKYKATERKKEEVEQKEMISLENGAQIEKEKYEQLQNQKKEQIESLKKAVSSATSFEVELSFDDDGEKQSSKFSYEYSEVDKHGMLSNTAEIDKYVAEKFNTKEGSDLKGYASFVDKGVNFDKYAQLIYAQGRADALEAKIARNNNENFIKQKTVEAEQEISPIDVIYG